MTRVVPPMTRAELAGRGRREDRGPRGGSFLLPELIAWCIEPRVVGGESARFVIALTGERGRLSVRWRMERDGAVISSGVSDDARVSVDGAFVHVDAPGVLSATVRREDGSVLYARSDALERSGLPGGRVEREQWLDA